MTGRLARIVRDCRSALHHARDTRVTFAAAGLSYYAFLSAIPILVFALAALRAIVGDGGVAWIRGAMGWSLPPSVDQLLEELSTGVAERTSVTLTGVIVLGWSVYRFVRGIENAFDMVYDVDATRSLTTRSIDTIVVILVVVAGLGMVVGVSIALRSLHVPRPLLTGPVVLTLLLVVVFQPLYYVLPNADVGLWAVLPGGLLAGATWAILHTGFRTYLEYGGTTEVYDIFGGVVVSMIWVYLGALALLLGAVANAVLAGDFLDDAA